MSYTDITFVFVSATQTSLTFNIEAVNTAALGGYSLAVYTGPVSGSTTYGSAVAYNTPDSIFFNGPLPETISNIPINGLVANTQYYMLLWYIGPTSEDTPVQVTPIQVTGNPSSTLTCYVKGSLILCVEQNNYIYKKIEDIKIGTEVITINSGIKAVTYIGYNTMTNTGTDPLGRIYVLKKSVNNKLIEDLYITGGHSILVDKLSEQEEVKTRKYWDENKKIDDKIMLLACVGDDFELVNNNVNETENVNTNHEIYHLCLENTDANKQYAINVNGILSETVSQKYILNNSGMKLKWD